MSCWLISQLLRTARLKSGSKVPSEVPEGPSEIDNGSCRAVDAVPKPDQITSNTEPQKAQKTEAANAKEAAEDAAKEAANAANAAKTKAATEEAVERRQKRKQQR